MSERASTSTRGAVPRQRSPADDREHVDRLLDRALADTFPASDPVSTLLPDPIPAQHPTQEREKSKPEESK